MRRGNYACEFLIGLFGIYELLNGAAEGLEAKLSWTPIGIAGKTIALLL